MWHVDCSEALLLFGSTPSLSIQSPTSCIRVIRSRVLVHPPGSNQPHKLLRSLLSMFSLYAVGLHLATYISITCAQVVVDGQVFTNALAIVDSPQPNSYVLFTPLRVQVSYLTRHLSVFHAGSPLPFAVDVRFIRTRLIPRILKACFRFLVTVNCRPRPRCQIQVFQRVLSRWKYTSSRSN